MNTCPIAVCYWLLSLEVVIEGLDPVAEVDELAMNLAPADVGADLDRSTADA